MPDAESADFGTAISYEKYEEKIDELRDGLREAYEAGYKKAIDDVENTGELPKKEDVEDSEYLAESHYYYWDGRTLPLEFWLRDQFDLDGETDEDQPSEPEMLRSEFHIGGAVCEVTRASELDLDERTIEIRLDEEGFESYIRELRLEEYEDEAREWIEERGRDD